MPIRLGSASVSLRLGSTPVTRAYLGSVQVLFPGSTTPTTPTTNPSKPPAPINAAAVTNSSGAATVTWDSAPGPTAWLIQYSSSNGSVWGDVPGGGVTYSSAPATTGVSTLKGTATLAGLTNGTTYVFRVAAQKDGVWSDYSMQTSAVTPAATLAAPTNLTVDVTSVAPFVRVSWDGGGVATQPFVSFGFLQYDLEKTENGGTSWTPAGSWLWRAAESDQRFVTVWGYANENTPNSYTLIVQGSFLPSTAYAFRLRRVFVPNSNAAGQPSAWSATSATVTTPSVPPDPPRWVTVEPVSSGLHVSWLAPIFPGSSAITSYRVYAVAAGSSVSGATPLSTVSATDASKVIFSAIDGGRSYNAMRAVLSSLTNGASYDVYVTAVNSAGESVAALSAEGTGRTPSADIPNAFNSFSASPGCTTPTRPPRTLWGEIKLNISRSEYDAWRSGPTDGSVGREVQFVVAGELKYVFGLDSIASSASWTSQQIRDPKWFWTASLPGGWTQTADTQEYHMRYSATNASGPAMLTGLPYVFRIRPVKGTVRGPWTYATVTTNCA